MHYLKDGICTGLGVIGAAIASMFGGWNLALATLLTFMIVDYISGLLLAGVFHTSNKTKTGTLESRAGWKGLCRKGMTLFMVLVAYRLDLVIGGDYIRNAVCIGFIANEAIRYTKEKTKLENEVKKEAEHMKIYLSPSSQANNAYAWGVQLPNW